MNCPQDAEDVTQQVWFKALTVLRAYAPEGRSFRRWLHRVAHNAAEDHRRKGRRLEGVAPDELDRWLDDACEAIPAWGDCIAVHDLVADLSQAERQVLALLYRWDLSPREAAGILRRSEPAVHKMHSRTLAKLRARLRTA